MQYAVELYFDKETEKKLMHLSQRLADEKLSTKFLEWKTRPHLFSNSITYLLVAKSPEHSMM